MSVRSHAGRPAPVFPSFMTRFSVFIMENGLKLGLFSRLPSCATVGTASALPKRADGPCSGAGSCGDSAPGSATKSRCTYRSICGARCHTKRLAIQAGAEARSSGDPRRRYRRPVGPGPSGLLDGAHGPRTRGPFVLPCQACRGGGSGRGALPQWVSGDSGSPASGSTLADV